MVKLSLRSTMANSDHNAQIVRFGLFEVDVQARELRKRGLKVRLQEQPFDILSALLVRSGEAVTREDLRRRLWPENTFVEFDHSLNTAISRLREALDDTADNPRFIETIPRKGYRFIAPVERTAGSADEPQLAKTVPPPATPPVKGSTRGEFRRTVALVMVSLAAVVAGVYAVRQRTPGHAEAPSSKLMLAVLPFQNLSGDPRQDFASEAMTEEMITHLGRLAPRQLGVIARTSVMKYRDSRADVRQIARELGVSYVLEGSLRRSHNSVDITAQLIQTSDQAHLWAESYDRPSGDLFAIEREIARRIAQSLALQLLPAQETALARASTVNTEAYEAYLDGRQHLEEGTEAGFRGAAEFFERAARLDPDYALAYDGMAKAYLQEADYHFISSADGVARARPAIDKALALDETIPESHVMLAQSLRLANPHDPGIDRDYRRALALNPSDADAHIGYAFFLRDNQRYEQALAEANEAVRLDPRAPFPHVMVGWVRLSMQQRDEATRRFQEALALDPNYPAGLYFLARTYQEEGRVQEAIDLLRHALASAGRKPKYLYALANAYTVAGQREEAQRILDELRQQSRHGYVDPVMISSLAAKLKG